MSTCSPRCDWFLGREFYFIGVHGFAKETFHLPTYVIDQTLVLEIFRQLVVIENAIGASKDDVAITQDSKMLWPIVLVKRLPTERLVTSKLV